MVVRLAFQKVVGSNQSTNGDNQNGDGSGKFEKRLFSVRYRYNNGQYAKNAFIKDNDGNVYYFDNTGRMAIGEKTIDGKQYFFLANGVQLRDWLSSKPQRSSILLRPKRCLECKW